MKLGTYRKLYKISSRIREEILLGLHVGDKIPSEQAISNQLGESYNLVHRALLILRNDGLVYVKPGRKGMFYTPRYNRNKKHVQEKIVLKFAISSRAEDNPFPVLKRVFDLFRMMQPEVEFEVVHRNLAQDADIYFTWPPLIDTSCWKEIDLSRIDAVPEMLDKALVAGQQYGKQFAIPILHAPASFWGHRNMLKKCGLNKKDFRDPEDFLEWGRIMEESGLCVSGYFFQGFAFHACQFGVKFQRVGDEFILDTKHVRSFFRAFQNLDRRKCSITPLLNYDLFHRGQQGLYPGYLNTLPITEKRFELLGMPRKEEGYVAQSIFIAGIGKHTKNEDLVYEFLNFLLLEHIQQLFQTPYVNFSILRSLYQKQYDQLRKETGADIPPYDPRSVVLTGDLDLFTYIGYYVYMETLLALIGKKDLDQVIRNIQRINIPERRRIWLQDASIAEKKNIEYYLKMQE